MEKMTIEAATKEKEKQLMDKKKIIQKDKEGSNLLISNVDDDSDTQARINSPTTSTGNRRRSRFNKRGGVGCASDGDNNSVSSGESPKIDPVKSHSDNYFPGRKTFKKKKNQPQVDENMHKVAYMGLRDGQDHKAREEQLRAVVIEFNKRDRERKDRFKLYGETYE